MNPSPKLSKYVFMPLALLQSELFWLYSVLYCMFRSGSDQPLAVKRPTVIKLNPQLDVLIEESDEETEDPSEPNDIVIGIRQRPTVIDELNGTTCPPIWWQKTRIRLGKPPVHSKRSSSDSSSDESACSYRRKNFFSKLALHHHSRRHH
ncbi:hypothetical protein A0J61_09924 [Choanephora cucurbitarum]|uniref:Uncharacterized protein n=1 Tax=Choanephora cucurbitarum TaxID=101091 RepID=A0A1C7MYW8_9FUNG|nr:hypothetical protein A0J61_09924 [Choanephora cucurbitarum]